MNARRIASHRVASQPTATRCSARVWARRGLGDGPGRPHLQERLALLGQAGRDIRRSLLRAHLPRRPMRCSEHADFPRVSNRSAYSTLTGMRSARAPTGACSLEEAERPGTSRRRRWRTARADFGLQPKAAGEPRPSLAARHARRAGTCMRARRMHACAAVVRARAASDSTRRRAAADRVLLVRFENARASGSASSAAAAAAAHWGGGLGPVPCRRHWAGRTGTALGRTGAALGGPHRSASR
jgi:hypothetical protein